MRTILGLFTLGLLALPGWIGCGDDDGGSNSNENNAGPHLSADLLEAEGRDPDFSCLGEPDPANVFATDTDVTGVVEDFEEGFPVEGVTVAVFASYADLAADTPFATSAPSDINGGYTVGVPANVQRLHYKMIDPTGQDYFDTMELEDPVAGMAPDPPQTTGKDRKAVSWATVDKVPGMIGIARIEGRGIVAGTVYDCSRDHVEHAALRVYDGPASDPNRVQLSIWDGSSRNSFYFSDDLPSRLQDFTNPEGQFLTANLVPGGTVTLEIWGRLDAAWLPAGYEDCAEGCLISRQEVPVFGDVIVITDMNPLYASN